MSEQEFLSHFINKSVDFKFHGQNLKFRLSQSLFSSHDIDRGTRLLLKTIARGIDFDGVKSLLDVGCGVGVVGISLKKRHPGISVTFQDRDALALSFTEINSKLNRIGRIELGHALAMDGLEGRKYDLIVSNLPGKAAPSVLAQIIRKIPGSLTESGRAAVVVVSPLADQFRETLLENGSRLTLEEGTKSYVAFHFEGGSSDEKEAGLSSYLRGDHAFTEGKNLVRIKTVFNLPGFDTLTYQVRLAARVLRDQQIGDNVLFWNPGQGYLPVSLASSSSYQPTHYTVAGRDALSLQITELNLREHGISSQQITAAHVPHYMDIDGDFDFIILMPDIDPGVPWAEMLLQKSADLLRPGGNLLLTAKSAFVHHLLAAPHKLEMKGSKKRDGFRALLMSKP